MKENIITSLDIGSGTIRLAVGQIQSNNQLNVISLVESLSEGVSKGIITNIEDTVSSISQCLEKAEKDIGLPINHAYVGISGTHIISQDARAVIAVSRADGDIRLDDVNRVLEAAKTVAIPPNYESIHIIPRYFTVDNQPNIKDPVGMTGVRLEVEAQIILGLISQIKNLRKCLYRVGLTDDELVFTPLATAEAVLNKRQKELGVAVVNLGDTTTSLAVFEEGDILTAKVLPIGSRHITSDIAIGLRISMNLAELIKLNFGSALPSKINKHEIINLRDLDKNEEGTIYRRQIAEIIDARCEEIFKMIDQELKTIDRSGKLPAGVVLTGAGVKLEGLIESGKRYLKLPVSLGIPTGFTTVLDKANDPSFATAIGLLLWGKQTKRIAKKGLSLLPPKIEWIKKIFKSLLP